MRPGFYDDTRYCPQCGKYVTYLLSTEAAYCVHCGARAAVLSAADLRALLAARPTAFAGRRPRATADASAAGSD